LRKSIVRPNRKSITFSGLVLQAGTSVWSIRNFKNAPIALREYYNYYLDAAAADKLYSNDDDDNRAATTGAITRSGLFTITAEKGFSYVFDLLDSYKITNLFYANWLRKALDNPLPD
ncbi:hypothetical protein L249_2580, partial [Ophiocordyceps polyrhachis-furcata BCC 54312]